MLTISGIRLAQVLEFVREKQDRRPESFEACQRAQTCFHATVRDDSIAAGEVCLKLADHYPEKDQLEVR